MQVRFFQERGLETLEKSINRWLAERADREIVDVLQSVSGVGADREYLVSVWYVGA